MAVGVVAVMTKEVSDIHMTRTDGSRGSGGDDKSYLFYTYYWYKWQ